MPIEIKGPYILMKEDLSLLSLYLLFDGRENWLLTGFSACAFGNSNANSISIKDFLFFLSSLIGRGGGKDALGYCEHYRRSEVSSEAWPGRKAGTDRRNTVGTTVTERIPEGRAFLAHVPPGQARKDRSGRYSERSRGHPPLSCIFFIPPRTMHNS